MNAEIVFADEKLKQAFYKLKDSKTETESFTSCSRKPLKT